MSSNSGWIHITFKWFGTFANINRILDHKANQTKLKSKIMQSMFSIPNGIKLYQASDTCYQPPGAAVLECQPSAWLPDVKVPENIGNKLHIRNIFMLIKLTISTKCMNSLKDTYYQSIHKKWAWIVLYLLNKLNV